MDRRQKSDLTKARSISDAKQLAKQEQTQQNLESASEGSQFSAELGFVSNVNEEIDTHQAKILVFEINPVKAEQQIHTMNT